MYNEGGYIVNKELLKRYLEIANRYDGEFSLEEFLLYTTYKVQDIFSLRFIDSLTQILILTNRLRISFTI